MSNKQSGAKINTEMFSPNLAIKLNKLHYLQQNKIIEKYLNKEKQNKLHQDENDFKYKRKCRKRFVLKSLIQETTLSSYQNKNNDCSINNKEF